MARTQSQPKSLSRMRLKVSVYSESWYTRCVAALRMMRRYSVSRPGSFSSTPCFCAMARTRSSSSAV